MKKWMYLIFPGAMLGIFLVFFLSHQKETEAKEAERTAVAAKKKADDDKAKAETEARAREDAAKKQAEREAEEKKKDDDRRAKQAAADKVIQDDIAAAKAEGDKFAKEATALAAQLENLRKDKDRLTRETFDVQKQVEAARVDRRTAELDAQRMMDMVAKQAQDGPLTRMPPPPPPPAQPRS